MDYTKTLEGFEEYINDIFSDIDSDIEKLNQSIKYSLCSGGKRIRPLLAILTFKEFSNSSPSRIYPVAAAIEFIHTYSLIHDDLPAMDDDDFRRNKPTNHKVFSEGIAILAGDSLLNMSCEILIKDLLLRDGDDLKNSIRAMKYIFSKSGMRGMIAGQMLDIDSKKIDYSQVIKCYKLKTSALISASIVSAGIIAGLGKEEIDALESFSENLGIAYQLKDDILDLEKEPSLTSLNKEQLEKVADEYTKKAIHDLNSLNLKSDNLHVLANKLLDRKY